jgi:phosphoserine phosphatase
MRRLSCSMSDLPLFGVLENTVAVNADPSLEAIAAVAYRGESLLAAYAHARTLLERP